MVMSAGSGLSNTEDPGRLHLSEPFCLACQLRLLMATAAHNIKFSYENTRTEMRATLPLDPFLREDIFPRCCKTDLSCGTVRAAPYALYFTSQDWIQRQHSRNTGKPNKTDDLNTIIFYFGMEEQRSVFQGCYSSFTKSPRPRTLSAPVLSSLGNSLYLRTPGWLLEVQSPRLSRKEDGRTK